MEFFTIADKVAGQKIAFFLYGFILAYLLFDYLAWAGKMTNILPGWKLYLTVIASPFVIMGLIFFVLPNFLAEFYSVGISDKSVNVRYLWPKRAQRVEVGNMQSISVIRNMWKDESGEGSTWILEFAGEDGQIFTSSPGDDRQTVLDAADMLRKVSGREISWFTRFGRVGGRQPESETWARTHK